MGRPSNPWLMALVLEAITVLADKKGSPVKSILDYIRRNAKVSSRNLTMQVHRALKHAVNAGFLRHSSGRYKALIFVNPITKGEQRTTDNHGRSDSQEGGQTRDSKEDKSAKDGRKIRSPREKRKRSRSNVRGSPKRTKGGGGVRGGGSTNSQPVKKNSQGRRKKPNALQDEPNESDSHISSFRRPRKISKGRRAMDNSEEELQKVPPPSRSSSIHQNSCSSECSDSDKNSEEIGYKVNRKKSYRKAAEKRKTVKRGSRRGRKARGRSTSRNPTSQSQLQHQQLQLLPQTQEHEQQQLREQDNLQLQKLPSGELMDNGMNCGEDRDDDDEHEDAPTDTELDRNNENDDRTANNV